MWPVAIIVLGILLRMMGISRPLLGNFSMYQTANGMIAKFFIENHFSTLLYPQVNILVGGKPGLHLLAYPISPLIASSLFSCWGGSIDFWGRFQSVIFFGVSSVYLYLLVRTLINEKIALGSLVVFGLAPLTLIYGQSFQNEMATVFFSLVFIFHWLRFTRKASLADFIASSTGLSGVFVTRPNCIYLLVPALFLALKNHFDQKSSARTLLNLGLITLGGSLVPALWYWHVWRVSNSAPNIHSTLFAQLMVRSSFGSPLVFSSEYYKSLFDTLAGIALTPIGFTLFIVGILSGIEKNREKRIFILWCASFLLTSLLIPRKLIDHNFYLLHLVVPASPLISDGFYRLVSSLKENLQNQKRFIFFFLVISFMVSSRYALNPAFKTSKKEKQFLEIARQVKSITDRQKSRVIVQGTHTLLYYSDRMGWGFDINQRSDISDYYKYMNWQKLPPDLWKFRNEALKDPRKTLEYLRKYEGATHFVVVDPEEFQKASDFASYMSAHFRIALEKKGEYVIFDLS